MKNGRPKLGSIACFWESQTIWHASSKRDDEESCILVFGIVCHSIVVANPVREV